MCNNLNARYCLNIERSHTSLLHSLAPLNEIQTGTAGVSIGGRGATQWGEPTERWLLQRGTKKVLSICAFIDACCPPWLTWFAGTMHFKYCVDSNWRNSAVGTGYLRYSYWSSHATATPHRYSRRKT